MENLKTIKKVKKLAFTMIMVVVGFHSAHGQNLVIKNINMIDVKNGNVKENMDVDITNGIISRISNHRPKRTYDSNIHVINGSGNYLMPGFIDSHVHTSMREVEVTMDGGQPVIGMKLNDELPTITANLLLKHGITTARDPGGFTDSTVEIKKKIASGEVSGPELLVAGSIIDTMVFVNLVTTVKSEDDLVKEIRRQKEAGVDFIKFYTSLSPELLEHGIREAKKLKLGTIAHLHGTSWTEASRLGVENIVHIIPGNSTYIPEEHKATYNQYELMGSKAIYKWFEYVDLESEVIADLIKTLKKNNTSVDPTLVVFHATFFGNTTEYTSNVLFNEYPKVLVDNWKIINFNLGWTEEDFLDAQKVWPKVQKFVKMLNDNDILLTTGTDSNNPWIIPGDSYHRELKLLANSGLTNAEILKMATFNGAQLLKIEDRTGTIEKGKEADLIMLKNNPLIDIHNTRDIIVVISNGVKFNSIGN